MSVIAIRKRQAKPGKVVGATQKEVDRLPLRSGTWSIAGEPGLYLACRATKSYFVQRRVGGKLVRQYLGSLTVKDAKEKARSCWGGLRDAPPEPGDTAKLTLGEAIEQYLERKRKRDGSPLADKTKTLARYNVKAYLSKVGENEVDWTRYSLEEIGENRAGLRWLQQKITDEHGKATSNQVVRLLAAVYRFHKDVDDEMPEWSPKAMQIFSIPPRDWAYSEQELRAWWRSEEEQKGPDGEPLVVVKGVSTLTSAIKRMWWLTTLLTGARKGSIESLRWSDVDLEKKTIHFAVAKGGRTYSVPMCDALAQLLRDYKERDDVPPSPWVFPSTVRDGEHIIDVKNTAEGVGPAHRLRHTYRTVLAQIGSSPDQSKLLMGHSLGGDVSRGYITSALVVESLRPVANAVAGEYLRILGDVALDAAQPATA